MENMNTPLISSSERNLKVKRNKGKENLITIMMEFNQEAQEYENLISIGKNQKVISKGKLKLR